MRRLDTLDVAKVASVDYFTLADNAGSVEVVCNFALLLSSFSTSWKLQDKLVLMAFRPSHQVAEAILNSLGLCDVSSCGCTNPSIEGCLFDLIKWKWEMGAKVFNKREKKVVQTRGSAKLLIPSPENTEGDPRNGIDKRTKKSPSTAIMVMMIMMMTVTSLPTNNHQTQISQFSSQFRRCQGDHPSSANLKRHLAQN